MSAFKWTDINVANLAKSLEGLGNGIYSATNTAVNASIDHKKHNDKLKHEENMRQIKAERQLLEDHFAMAKKNLDLEIHDYFSEAMKNPDYSQYQKGWDEKYSSLMTTDHLKSLGLNDEEAQRYIDERGDMTKKAGDIAASYYANVSMNNSINQNTKAKVNLLALDGSKSTKEKLDEWGEIYNDTAKGADISGSNDPANKTNVYNFMLTSLTANGKRAMESAISGEMSYQDALKKIEDEYDSDMQLIRDKFGSDSDFATTELDIKTTRDTYLTAMKKYWVEQNTTNYTDNQASASDAYAMIAEAKADNTAVDLTKLDELLNKAGITEDSKNANSNEIRNTLFASANQQNQSIRGTSEKKVNLMSSSDELDLKTQIANYDTTLSNGYYSYSESGEAEVADEDSDEIRDFLDSNLYTIQGGDEKAPLSVKTKYKDLVDDYCKKNNITSPAEKMLVASQINNMALEMNIAGGSASSSSTGTSGSMDFNQMNASEAIIYNMIREPNQYSVKDVIDTYNIEVASGHITPAFASVYEKEFGTDGSKRSGDIYYTTAKNMASNFTFALGSQMSSDDKNALIWDIAENGSMAQIFDDWLRSNPDALNDTRKQADYINQIADYAFNSKCSKDIENIIDSTYKMAVGKTDDKPGLDKATTSEILTAIKTGEADILIDVDSYSIIKGMLYSDQSKTYSKDSLFDTAIGSISNGKYKTLSEMEKDKSLSDSQKQSYKNRAYLTVGKATYEASQYKSAENLAKLTGGETSLTKGTGEGCREVRVKGYGIGCLDNAGFVYLATGDNQVEIYHIDPSGTEFNRVTNDNNSSLYPWEMDAGGVYDMEYYKKNEFYNDFAKDMSNTPMPIQYTDVMTLYNGADYIRTKKTDEERKNDPQLRMIMTKALVTTRGKNTNSNTAQN